MVNIRGRSIGLSRNQKVPSVLSKVKGRTIASSSPQAASPAAKTTLFTHDPGSSDEEGELTQRWSPVEDSRKSSPLRSRTSKSQGKGWQYADDSRRALAGDSNPDEEQQQKAAIFNPPPASSDSEDDTEDEHIIPSRDVPSLSGGLLLDDSDSDGRLARRGDLRPTKFTSRTANGDAALAVNGSGSIMKSSQVSSLSQPMSSAGSHLENEVGHVRKPKAKQTYRKPKPPMKVKASRSKRSFEEHDAPESPEKKRISFQAPDDSDDCPSSRHPERTLKPGLDSDSDSGSISTTRFEPLRKRKGRASSDCKSREEKKSKPTFWVPDGSPDRDIKREPAKEVNKSVRRLSSTSLSDLDLSDEELPTAATTDKASTCPWCGQPIRPEALKDFAKGRRLNVQMQTKFCRSHQKQSAKDKWNEKGYPIIDWSALAKRFQRHHDILLDVVNGQSSFFRDALATDIKAGKSRTLRKEEDFTPGYYGPRGFNMMSDYLVTQFSDLLKERAVSDRVIAGRGSAAFVQAVLVAELAVQLIKEDMNVGDDEARNVLAESKEVGEIVHEEA